MMMNWKYWEQRLEDASFEHYGNDVVFLHQAKAILGDLYEAAHDEITNAELMYYDGR